MNHKFFIRPGKPDLAYVFSPAQGSGEDLPPVIFLGGYRSDMNGTKALYLEGQCRVRGRAFLRFDYAGHGLSGGAFNDGCISDWAADAAAVMDAFIDRPCIMIGSSMGGWIALLLARADMHSKARKIKAVIGIAAAPDFTRAIYARLSPAQIDEMNARGIVSIPNHYSDTPYSFTRKIYEDGENNILLDKINRINFPLRLLQGKQDQDVPWQTAPAIAGAFQGPDTKIIYIDDGDHRLSRPQDLKVLDDLIVSVGS